jgi:hypothetical protein
VSRRSGGVARVLDYRLRTGGHDPGPPVVEKFESKDQLGRGHNRGGAKIREPKEDF